MTEFIAIVVVIIVIAYFIGKNRSKKKSSEIRKNDPVKKTEVQKPKQDKIVTEKVLYKTKGIKSFDLKGMFYQKLNPKIHSGSFIGLAKCNKNSHDKYAVEIYNNENVLLGYTPKGNIRLNNSLKEWNNGKVIVWGGLGFDNFENKWLGTVHVPVGFTTVQLEKVQRVLNLMNENQLDIKSKEKSTDKYSEILKRHTEIKTLLNELNNPVEFYYSFPKNLIPSISSHLEKEKNWSKLIELEKHQDLISELNEKFKAKTLMRIEKAKENIA